MTEEVAVLESDMLNLDDEIMKVRNVPVILGFVNAGISVSLYQDVQDLHGAINIKNVDTKKLMTLVDKIYLTLLKNSADIPKDDSRLIGYSSFKDDLEHYTAVIDGQQQIQKEIDSLYAIENVKALAADAIEEDAWAIYWQERLNALKESAQNPIAQAEGHPRMATVSETALCKILRDARRFIVSTPGVLLPHRSSASRWDYARYVPLPTWRRSFPCWAVPA